MNKTKLLLFNNQASIVNTQYGYTLIELLVVIGITALLLGIVTINLVGTQQKTSLSTAEDSLIADIKSQQMKAMQGTSGGGNFGIHFASGSTYTLFQGAIYNSLSPNNADVSGDGSVSFSDASDLVFDSLTGEIHGYSSPVTITVTNIAGGQQKTIQLNKYGVVIGE